jgi:hypothetical protein
MAFLLALSGFKTYIAAIGILGLATYQLSIGQGSLALQSLLTAVTTIGLRQAMALSSPKA